MRSFKSFTVHRKRPEKNFKLEKSSGILAVSLFCADVSSLYIKTGQLDIPEKKIQYDGKESSELIL